MRSSLTLKKKASPFTAESENTAQTSEESKQTPKEARAAANRLLNEAQHARRLAHWDKVKPMVDAYFGNKAIFLETIKIDGEECLRPLEVGVHKTIFSWLRERPETLGCSNILLTDLIKSVLVPHVSSPQYIIGLLKSKDRFDLDGKVAGVVSEKQKARAEKVWRKSQKKVMPEG